LRSSGGELCIAKRQQLLHTLPAVLIVKTTRGDQTKRVFEEPLYGRTESVIDRLSSTRLSRSRMKLERLLRR
jgi:hypothetical protein